MRPVFSCLMLCSAVAILLPAASEVSARGGGAPGARGGSVGFARVGFPAARGYAFRQRFANGRSPGYGRTGHPGFPHAGLGDVRRRGYGGDLGYRHGGDRRYGFDRYGGYGYGGYGLLGGAPFVNAAYGSARPFQAESGLPVAAGIASPPVLPPAIYVLGSKSSTRSGVRSPIGRSAGVALTAGSSDAAGESGVVSSRPRLSRLR